MADIHLHAGSAPSVTCVSNYFIDHSLKELSGDAVKVYLTLLRLIGGSGESFSCSDMAGRLGVTARDVRTSLDELAASDLVALDYDSEGELCDICVKECAAEQQAVVEEASEPSDEETTDEIAESVQQPAVEEVSAEEDEAPAPEKKSYSEDERNNPEVKTLLFIVGRYMGHSLSPKDLQDIMYWYYDLHMDVDAIDYLVTSSLEKGKSSISYMNQVAIAWYRKGIHTKDEATVEQKQFSTETNTVRKAFGISGHAMTPAEIGFIDKWFHEWGFAPELVEEACSRTIINTGKPNYTYADRILDDWHKKGLTSLDQIAADDETHRQENEKKYPSKAASGQKANSFSFTESNGYDDAAIASAMLKRNTF